jgi:hypothetical protein
VCMMAKIPDKFAVYKGDRVRRALELRKDGKSAAAFELLKDAWSKDQDPEACYILAHICRRGGFFQKRKEKEIFERWYLGSQTMKSKSFEVEDLLLAGLDTERYELSDDCELPKVKRMIDYIKKGYLFLVSFIDTGKLYRPEVFEVVLELAEFGDACACCLLGDFYQEEDEYALAYKWYLKGGLQKHFGCAAGLAWDFDQWVVGRDRIVASLCICRSGVVEEFSWTLSEESE